MTKEEKNELLTIINIKLSELDLELKELEELTKPIPLDAAIGRISRMDAINNKTINESSLREKKKIKQRLERALENADAKDFGLCKRCGKEIPFGRLEYMPHTTRCVHCVGR